MRTLHIGLRVSNLERSLGFYKALGYAVVGTVPGTEVGDLTMLKLPGDEFVTVELASSASAENDSNGPGLNHLVIMVESLSAAVSDIAARGIDADERTGSGEPDHPRTTWITDRRQPT